jgi:hypothetical protein
MTRRNAVLALALAAVFGSGCGSSDDPEPQPTVNEEACEHMQLGPSAARTATASAAGAPAISNDHVRYDVTLVPVTGGNGGVVTFAAAEATDYVLFLDANVPVAVTGPTGVAITPEEVLQSIPECTDVRTRVLVPLTVGTHQIQFGPTAGGIVRVVVEEALHVP